MESIALRPRKATEIVDAAIEVYRRNPVHFLLLGAVVRVPWLIVQILFVAGHEKETTGFIISMLISVGTLVTYLLMSGLLIDMASELYLGRPTDAFETLRRVAPKMIPVFVASLLQSVAVAIGFVLFLFPAIWVTALMFAVVPVIVIEKRGIFAAFGRSSQLSAGMKSHILSALGLVVLIRVIIEVGFGAISLLVPMPELRYVIVAIAGLLTYPVIGIAEALIYYDVRIRKEGFDIEMMARQASEPVPASV